MSFQSPLALIGLVVVPVLVGLYVVRERRRQSYASRFTATALLPNLVDAAPGWRRHLPVALFLVALAAMIVGVARPHASMSVQREEATVLIAIDSSLSMSAQDVRPSRLAAAQSAAQAFVDGMPKKFRVGVIGFAGRAYVAVPPTQDRELVHNALRALKPGQGTALGDAVALGTRLARAERTSDGRIPPTAMLVISDGAQKSGRTTPDVAAAQAKSLHIPVYTVVVGTQDGVVNVPVAGGYQAQLRVPPSPDTLRAVASVTGGQFFTAPDATRLRQIYQKLGSRLGRRHVKREVSDLFAGGSAALMLLGGALSALWFRRVP
ncbi:MAG TPA: VWA domain-containing protein [Gaiellaceae bacterium]|nr:VWA domain-containing protein [Gaiellaceae bacterium]